MAENQTIDQLRWSLAQKRMQADAHLHNLHEDRVPMPSLDELLESTPVRIATAHPVVAGLAVGVIFLVGPARLMRLATTAIGLLQSARTLRAAPRALMS